MPGGFKWLVAEAAMYQRGVVSIGMMQSRAVLIEQSSVKIRV